MKMLKTIALMAALAMMAMMAGGCAYNATDRTLYDSYYAADNGTDTAGKVVFDVPYVQMKEQRINSFSCDSGTIVAGLKNAFGDRVVFRHDAVARIVGWKSMDVHIPVGFVHNCTTTDVATYTDANGKTAEITGTAHWTVPWRYSAEFFRTVCLDASQDIARQIKVLVDSESK